MKTPVPRSKVKRFPMGNAFPSGKHTKASIAKAARAKKVCPAVFLRSLVEEHLSTIGLKVG